MGYFLRKIYQRLKRQEDSLDRIEQILSQILIKEIEMANAFDTAYATLITAVTNAEGRLASLETLTAGLSDFIRNNVGNTQALLDLATRLDTDTAGIDAAIAANPLPTPPPVV